MISKCPDHKNKFKVSNKNARKVLNLVHMNLMKPLGRYLFKGNKKETRTKPQTSANPTKAKSEQYQ